MRRPLLQLSTAVLLALAATASVVPVVSAECFMGPTPDIRQYRGQRGFVFTGRVASISNRPTRSAAGDSVPFEWEAVLDIVHVYRGRVDEPLVIDSWYSGCSSLNVRGLRPGEEILVAYGGKFFPDPPTDPELWGPLLIWQRDGTAWRFHQAALSHRASNFPPEARRATTTEAILRLVAPGATPDTATSGPGKTVPPQPPAPLIAFGALSTLGLAFALRRRTAPGQGAPAETSPTG
jgi:hypothetical protein